MYDFRRCQDHIHRALLQEMSHRGDRGDATWIEREREAVAIAANQWATAHGMATVTVDDVERVEPMAVGHMDYGSKLALYVTELVFERGRATDDKKGSQ